MPRCYVDEIEKILEEINIKLIKDKKKIIKKAAWHSVLNSFTPNIVKPFWINECFRKNHFESLNAMQVKTAIEAQLKSLGINRDVKIICID